MLFGHLSAIFAVLLCRCPPRRPPPLQEKYNSDSENDPKIAKIRQQLGEVKDVMMVLCRGWATTPIKRKFGLATAGWLGR